MHSLIGRWSARAAHPGAFRAARWPLGTACILASLLLVGCASSGGSNPPSGLLDNLFASPAAEASPPPEEEKGRCATAAECKTVLKTMIDNPDRSWVGQPQSPEAYANGTRLFAYRVLRQKLSCGELTRAVEEMRVASKSLGGSVPGVAPEQVSRTRALSTQVEGELAKERARRCRA